MNAWIVSLLAAIGSVTCLLIAMVIVAMIADGDDELTEEDKLDARENCERQD